MIMKNKTDLVNPVSKAVVNLLDKVLQIDANSASCVVFYQPEAPKELQRFKKKK